MNTQKIPYASLFVILAISISMISCSSASGPGGDDNGNGNNGGGEPVPNEVQMVGQSFSPSSIEVEAGTTVTWVNESSLIHTVTSGTNGEHDGLFDSGNIAPDGQFSYQFTEVGTYSYYCIPHVGQGMTGSVTVTAAE